MEVGASVGVLVGVLVGLIVGNLAEVEGRMAGVEVVVGEGVTVSDGVIEFATSGPLRLAQAATAVISREEMISTIIMVRD